MSYNGSVETSALAGVACNAILYGVQLVVFPICMILLIQRQRLKSVHFKSWMLISAVIAQFIFSTMYISIQLYMTFQSFVHLQPTGSTSLTTSSTPAPGSGMQTIVPEPSPTWWTGAPPIPTPTTALLSKIDTSEPIFSVSGWGSESQPLSAIALYWIDTTSKVQILSSTVCFVNTIVGDGILIWRLYHVWGKKWIFCVPPIVSLTASVICAALMIGIQAASIYSVVDKLAMASWALSICTQVIASLLIAFKIWNGPLQYVDCIQKIEVSNRYRKIILVVIESGAIYSTMALALLIFYSIRQMDAAVVLMGCIGQTAAIIPATIVILLHLPLTAKHRDLSEMELSLGSMNSD